MGIQPGRVLALLYLSILSALAWGGPVDINTADAATLARELKGVGEHTAQAIVSYRETHGPFASASDLLRVKGIGTRTLELNLENIVIAAESD